MKNRARRMDSLAECGACARLSEALAVAPRPPGCDKAVSYRFFVVYSFYFRLSGFFLAFLEGAVFPVFIP